MQPLRVLMIEDSRHIRTRIRSMLEDTTGVSIVAEAESTKDALRCFRRSAPDAVLLDLQLTDGASSGVLSEIKHINPACLVVVLTNFDTTEFRDVCLQLGADYFLSKANDFDCIPEILVERHAAINAQRLRNS